MSKTGVTTSGEARHATHGHVLLFADEHGIEYAIYELAGTSQDEFDDLGNGMTWQPWRNLRPCGGSRPVLVSQRNDILVKTGLTRQDRSTDDMGEGDIHMIDDAAIQKAADLLRRAAPGSTVILFGSYARGQAGAESDVDLLVVESNVTSPRDEMVRLRDVVRPLRIPVEVLVVSRKTFDEWADTPGTVFYEAAREGRVLDAVA